VGCYLLWGFLPLYFHLLSGLGVGSWEMIAHRTLWAAPWAFLAVLLARQGGRSRPCCASPAPWACWPCSTAAIFINWSIYVFAVNANHVIEASLGYYINPLMNMAAGALLFRERISREGAIAIGLAVIGVAIQTAALGHLPIISLGVA
jgi:chloramphenicol-sensitive protein RarD